MINKSLSPNTPFEHPNIHEDFLDTLMDYLARAEALVRIFQQQSVSICQPAILRHYVAVIVDYLTRASEICAQLLAE